MNQRQRITRLGLGATVMATTVLSCTTAAAEPQGPIPVEVIETEQGWQLLRGGEPYTVKGAGGFERLEMLKEMGGNSVRTWGAGDLEPRMWEDGRTMSLMDRAHELGMTVSAGFWVQHYEGGYIVGDFDYDDPAQVEAQLQAARQFANKWKDHPALLVWGVGNEALGDDRPRALKELNRIAKAIKEIDPDHPTMTVLSGVWPDKGELFAKYCPDIDILGINAYGGVVAVPQELLRQGYEGPYMITEYGPIGHWESAKTPWGAEVEQSSAGKARTYMEFHKTAITNQPDRCLGGYVFLWGQKQERTDTWYGMFLSTGEKTPAVDVMAQLWGADAPPNLAPLVDGITTELAMKRVKPGSEFEAVVEATDLENDQLKVKWVVRRESDDKRAGGEIEQAPEDVSSAVLSSEGMRATVQTPQEPGAYRLHVYVRDGQGGAGAANVPFYVSAD